MKKATLLITGIILTTTNVFAITLNQEVKSNFWATILENLTTGFVVFGVCTVLGLSIKALVDLIVSNKKKV